MDFLQQETLRRTKNLIDSLMVPEPEPDETYSITRAIAAKYAFHKPGFPDANSPPWADSLERAEHAKLVRRRTALGLDPTTEGDILIPNWAWMNKRVMDGATGGKGGFAVGTEMPFRDSLLRQRSVAFQAGVQLVDAANNSFAWPKQTGASSATWLNPGGSASSSNPAFIQITSTPKTLLTFLEVPISLLTQAGPAGEAFLVDGLSRDMATAVDAAVLNGSGASGQPLGIIPTPNVGTVNGSSIDYAKCVEFQTDVSDNNAVLDAASLAYVTTPTVAALLKSRQRFTGTDSPLWKGGVHQGEIEGVQAMSTKQMPASNLLFGDFSTVYVVQGGALAIRVNPYQDFNRGYVGIRAMWLVDVVVRYPLAFSVATGVS